MPLRWQSEISAWALAHQFVYEQRRGLYRRWHHEHTFESIEGGAAIDDVAGYRGLGWSRERLVNRLFIRPDVVRILTDRHQQLLAQDGLVPGAS